MDYTQLISIINSKTKDKFNVDDVTLALQEVEVAIKNYCHRAEVPGELYFTWCNMSIDLLDYEAEKNKAAADVQVTDVSDVKIGDVSFKVGTPTSGSDSRSLAIRSHRLNLDDIVMNYRDQLNNFRRIW
jgi:hypothetical protein